jgi:phage terminase large subunit-like protein
MKLAGLSDDDIDELLHEWRFWARPSQMTPPGDWRTWLVMAGRGYGKTRVGAEWIRESVKHFRLVNLIGATADDARDIMIEGESGILAICPEHERPLYLPSKRRMEWPNGATSLIFTADEPDRLRGKQHERLWCDEIAAWKYAQEAWDQAMFGLRLGNDPRCVATTTPKPVALVRTLMADPNCTVTRGSTYENRENLAPAFFTDIITKYEGTRLGRQELDAELLDDVPGALWQRKLLDDTRVTEAPTLKRIVVGVDPSVTSGEQSAETGIIVAGLGVNGHGYVLDDRSRRDTPQGWATAAVTAYHAHKADRMVAEVNNGGEMVKLIVATIDPRVAYKPVHAQKGKAARAEPIAALYEQGRVHHVGTFDETEDQMCSYTPGAESPDRLDALVWALTELMLGARTTPGMVAKLAGM